MSDTSNIIRIPKRRAEQIKKMGEDFPHKTKHELYEYAILKEHNTNFFVKDMDKIERVMAFHLQPHLDEEMIQLFIESLFLRILVKYTKEDPHFIERIRVGIVELIKEKENKRKVEQ